MWTEFVINQGHKTVRADKTVKALEQKRKIERKQGRKKGRREIRKKEMKMEETKEGDFKSNLHLYLIFFFR